jgi:hypothetical protein
VGTIIADSVKDFAPGISDDKVGSAINLPWQEAIARDIQLMLLHHERKAAKGAKRVHSLEALHALIDQNDSEQVIGFCGGLIDRPDPQTLGTILTRASCTALSRSASCWASWYGMARMR